MSMPQIKRWKHILCEMLIDRYMTYKKCIEEIVNQYKEEKLVLLEHFISKTPLNE